MNYIEVNQLIELLNDIYLKSTNRDSEDFLNGHCFYFVKIIHTLIPEVSIYKMDSHYIFFLEGLYFDTLKNFESNKDFIYSRTRTEAPFPIQKLVYIHDLIEEENLASSSGITQKIKEINYQYYSPFMIERGNPFLEELRNQKKRNLS